MSTASSAAAAGGMRTFVLVWLGQVVSYVGSAMAAFAIGVKIFQVTGSVSRFALTSLAIALPILVISPLAGRMVDRYDHRKILILSHLGAGGAYLVLYFLVSAGQVTSWHVYPLIALGSVFSTFVWPAMSAATTLLVGRAQLGRASGMLQMGLAMAQVAGPLLGGLLLVVMGLPGLIVVNVVSYLLATIALLLVRFPTVADSVPDGETSDRPAGSAASGADSAGGDNPWGDRADAASGASGWGFLKARPGLLRLLMLFAVLNFVVGMVQVLITPLVLSFAGPTTLGLVLAIAASGMLVGSTLMAVWGGTRQRIPLILVTIALQGVILFAASFRPSASLIAIAAFFFLFGVPLVTASSQALWQLKTPVAIQGRVFALRRMIGTAAVPLAQAAAGPLVDYVFEPLAARGAFDRLLGPIVGLGSGADTHAGRGIAVLLVGLGSLLLVAVAVAATSRALRRAEVDIPDALDATDSESAVDPAAEQARRPNLFARMHARHGWLLATAGLAAAVLALMADRPPRALGIDAPADQFSAFRARAHIEAISTEPHPVGTAAQARVRTYLREQLEGLGLEVEEQATTIGHVLGRTQVLADVVNVMARQPGSVSTTPNSGARHAILLAAHYDTVPSSNGAADNGAGVAALLETARALRSAPPLDHDVIFLFTDSEELGLLGARAFLRRHPWSQDVAAVLNFDARGSRGPSFMFRTGHDNGWWLPHFFAAPDARGNSLMASLFRLLPNRTDFSVFQASGLPGFDFAFIDGLTHYHTDLDRTEAVSLRSVQHHGANALALTHHLANLDLTADATHRSQPDRAYFTVLGGLGIHYGQGIAWASAVIVVGLFLGVLWVGRRRLSVGGVALGFLAQLVLLLAIPILISLMWMGLRDLAGIPVIMGSTPAAHTFMVGFSLLALAAGLVILRFFRRQIDWLDLAIAGIVWWLILLVLTSDTSLPVVANYVIVWPLMPVLVLLLVLIRRPEPWPPGLLCGILFLASLPALLLLVPLVRDFYIAMQSLAELGGGALVPGILLLALLVAPLDVLNRTLPRTVPLIAAGLGLGLVSIGVVTTLRAKPGPELSSAVYTVDTETGRAAWFSFDPQPNRWNRQFGFEAGKTSSFDHFYPLIGRPLLSRAEPSPPPPSAQPPVQPTAVTLLSREPNADGSETVRLSFQARDDIYGRTVVITPQDAVRAASWVGERVTWREPVKLLLRVPVQPNEIMSLDVDRDTTLTLTVVDQQPTLPKVPSFVARTPADLPRPYLTVLRTDVTLVRSVFEIAAHGAEEVVPRMLVPVTKGSAMTMPPAADGQTIGDEAPGDAATTGAGRASERDARADQSVPSISASRAAAVSSSTSASI